MRHILTAAAAIAVSGLLVSTAAVAQYQAGGPTNVAGMCKVSTDGMGNDSFGYYAPCAPSAAAAPSGAGTAAYARAPSGGYEAGGPSRVGGLCKVSTDGMGNDSFGYFAPCK
jgi:hypothetical protein